MDGTEVLKDAGDTLELRCEGKSPLEWNIQSTVFIYFFLINLHCLLFFFAGLRSVGKKWDSFGQIRLNLMSV